MFCQLDSRFGVWAEVKVKARKQSAAQQLTAAAYGAPSQAQFYEMKHCICSAHTSRQAIRQTNRMPARRTRSDTTSRATRQPQRRRCRGVRIHCGQPEDRQPAGQPASLPAGARCIDALGLNCRRSSFVVGWWQIVPHILSAN